MTDLQEAIDDVRRYHEAERERVREKARAAMVNPIIHRALMTAHIQLMKQSLDDSSDETREAAETIKGLAEGYRS